MGNNFQWRLFIVSPEHLHFVSIRLGINSPRRPNDFDEYININIGGGLGESVRELIPAPLAGLFDGQRNALFIFIQDIQGGVDKRREAQRCEK